MRGLIQKDLCLVLQRSRVLVVIIGIGALMGMSTDGSFVIGFLTMICAILTVGTISYDEFDNGYPFIMTLPITRKTYVDSKYVFCLMGGLVGWIISLVIYFICMIVKGNTITISSIAETAAFIPVLVLLIALLLPMQLKYGAEKSRVVIIAVGGTAWALGYFVLSNLPNSMKPEAFFTGLSDTVITVALVVICIILLAVSYFASLHIMEKKEY
ncbi:MAG: ABC-2 transporter permease [Eubacteriaceae bacterium]|nr:ABC-2 transporter permease [Eubacteriaceae bacterium]